MVLLTGAGRPRTLGTHMSSRTTATRVLLAACVLAAALVASPDARANFPGANGKVAYVRTDPATETSHVYVAGPDGSHPERITSEPKAYGGLDWSADGSKLAFEVATVERTEVWVMNQDGSEARRVSPAGQSRYNPSWSPDGRYLAVDDRQTIYRIDTEAGHELALTQPEETTLTCLEQEYTFPVYYHQPSWSPEGARIAVIRWHELAPTPAMDSCDFTPFFDFDLAVIPAGGGAATMVTDDPSTLRGARYDALPDWSPDGSKIVVQRGAVNDSDIGIAVVASGGGAVTRLTNFGARPRWSPDGTKILFTRDEDGNGLADVWTMDASDGSDLAPLLQDDRFGFLYQDWQPTTAGELEVTLNAFGPDGTSLLDDVVGMSQTVLVELTIENPGDEEVTGFRFADDAPLVVDERSTGGLEITSQPVIDPNLTLDPEEEVTFAFEVTATANGIAAAHTKVTATDADGRTLEDVHSLKFVIEDGAEMTDAMGQYLILQAVDQLILQSARSWIRGMTARGNDLHQRLSAIFTPEQRRRWFGSETALPLTPTDFAIALLRGSAPEMVAASLPKSRWEGFTAQQLNRAYDDAFKNEVGKGVAEYVDGYRNLAGSAKRFLQDSYSEALMTSYVLFGTATPEERMQVGAYMYAVSTGTDASVDNLVNTLAREIPRWKENGTYLDQALDMAVADAFLLSPDLQNQMAAERAWRENVLRTAQTDPVGFQKAVAKRDAEIFNLGMPLVLDTIIGGAVTRVDVGARNVVVRGRGASVLRTGEALGALDDAGGVSRRPLKVKVGDSSAPGGTTAGEAVQLERAGAFFDDVEGATILQSTDAGAVYELPNLGGVPETTLEAKAGILRELESEYARRFGQPIKLAEVLKPSSALRKAGGTAKLELTPQKTGKPAMLDAGAPPEVLAEASVWRNTTHPADQAGWTNLSKARQEAALKEWRAANQRWDEWLDPPAGSKTARLQQCIGRRSRVPLDTEPNAAGLQRFVEAEFEEVVVREGTAEARLIRAKYYRIETVDTTRGNRVVNSKVVVDSPTAVPQTPDADAVALGKVTGASPDGSPIVAPLSRAEREFLAQRYIDKNVKARRKPAGAPGAIPDAAEHGTTLIMDDASAQAAGKLLPSYGVPFLPESVGRPLLRRIAPFVAKIPPGTGPAQRARIIEAQYKQMLHAVRSEGGFGQHAIVVTSDSRYLGAVQFASW
jgi:hypothetical protein